MSNLTLKSLDIVNFRSIRGQIHAPLDAKVVLVHGENGAGKTSLLSAIELALTGRVQSLERADQDYGRQLLHRSADGGSVLVKTLFGETEQAFKAVLDASGVASFSAFDEAKATFFRERAFLPQSLLGQLLQIYQDAGNDAGSPLAQFVGKLLGLDRLDALEAGLKPLADVRNVRKTVDGWPAAENERTRIDRLLSDQRKSQKLQQDQITNALAGLAAICTGLAIAVEVREDGLEAVEQALRDEHDTEAFARLSDQQRRLAALRREIETAQESAASNGLTAAEDTAGTGDSYQIWQAAYGDRVAAIRLRVEGLFPDLSLESAPEEAARTALARLRTERKQLGDRVSQARGDLTRHALAQDERDVALRQRDTIDTEVAQLPTSAGSLGSALAELTSFITDDICPVCDRDFSEVGKVPLSDHVHNKVRSLSASAERLLTLGRARSEAQVVVERLEREIETVSARKHDEEVIADLDRRLAGVTGLISEIDGLADVLAEGARLRTAEVASRRAITENQSRNLALTAARDTLSDFADLIGADPLSEGESFTAGVARMEKSLSDRASDLEARLAQRRRASDFIETVRAALTRRKEIDEQIKTDFAAWQRADQSLDRAQKLREQGNMIRSTVDTVRSAIIRREFNDRLNRVWRDLFVRLAPAEPFVPAFRIPKDSTQKLQPKLITEHRDGGVAGGTPGAMLSAGNLNTAALTLFIALHLSVPRELPWLILDDPVQSMDDVHIAHFAALLRTLSKEHGRQIMIAVHDRQLFEYLRLELSPAFAEDSLLTLELSRGARRDSLCVSRRYSFKEETALLAAA